MRTALQASPQNSNTDSPAAHILTKAGVLDIHNTNREKRSEHVRSQSDYMYSVLSANSASMTFKANLVF